MALPGGARSDGMKSNREFNRPGNILIADQFNNRVIRVSPSGQIVASYV
jgi:hypothetical protein